VLVTVGGFYILEFAAERFPVPQPESENGF